MEKDKKKLIETAKKKVQDKQGFYKHLYAFCAVASALFLINYFTPSGTWWFVLPLIGWAMAVLGHYLNVFGLPNFKDEVWEKKQLKIEMDKLERTQNLDDRENEVLDISNEKLELKELKEERRNYNSDDYV